MGNSLFSMKNILLALGMMGAVVGATVLGVYVGVKSSNVADSLYEARPATTNTNAGAPSALRHSGRTAQGETVNLADFEGQIVVIDFWATWCPPCRAKMPELVALQERYRDKGVQFIGVSGDRTASDLASFERQNNINFPTIFHGAESIIRSFNVRAFPTLVIIDREGKVVYQQTGGAGFSQRLSEIVGSG